MEKKVDDEKLLEMLAQGVEQKEIAAFFGCSPSFITKRKKRLQVTEIENPLLIEKLTGKERSFCLEVASGKSQTQAALTAYDVSSRSSAKALGSTLMRNGDIREALAQIRERHLPIDHLCKRLRQHVDNSDASVSQRAIDTSLRLHDAFPATKSLNITANVDISPIDLTPYLNGDIDERRN